MKNGPNVEISAESRPVAMIKSAKNVRQHAREDVNVKTDMCVTIMENVLHLKCVRSVPDVKPTNTGISVEVHVTNQIANILLDTAKINVESHPQYAHQDVSVKLDL